MWGLRLVVSVVVCTLTMIMFLDDLFLVDFKLVNQPTLFPLINENGEYFFLDKKMLVVVLCVDFLAVVHVL